MKLTLYTIIFLLLSLLPKSSKATHIVGGELYYESLGNNQYKVILKVYRDCLNGQVGFDDPASVGIFDSNGALVDELLMYSPVITLLPVTVDNPCLQVPPVICTEEGIYTEIITLPGMPGGYDLVYQRCCRNNIIQNIVNPEISGSTYISHIPGPEVVITNSAPYFINLPPLVLCNGEDFIFDHSAFDPDGDQLVYEFCDPYLGASDITPMPQPPNTPPYNNITWSGSYGTNNQILGTPNLQINATTGQLTCTPSTNGIYVVGICVKEYRNGVLINTTLRDFQFTVVTCSQNVISVVPDQPLLPNLSVPCDGLTISFTNESVNSSYYFWDFGVPGLDSDTSILENPVYTYPDTGLYQVTLIANPGWPCADTSIATYLVQYPITGTIAPVSDQCFDGNSFNFDITGNFTPSAQVNWSFSNSNPPGSTSFSPANIQFLSPGIQSVVATVSDRQCTRDFVIQFNILNEPTAVTNGELVCNNLTFSPSNNSSNATGYFWDFGDGNTLADTSNMQNPSYTYALPGVYTVTLIADNNEQCFDTTSAIFDIREPISPGYSTMSPQCIDVNSFNFQTTGNYSNNATFTWDFSSNATPSSSTLENPVQIVYDTAGTFTVVITVEDQGCFASYTDSVLVYPIPTFNPIIVGDTGCAPYSVTFVNSSNYLGNANSFWDFGDGSSSSEQSPTHQYLFPGTYTVSYQLNTLEGCIRNFQQTFTDAIVVYPSPTADFSMTEPDITETVVISDNSSPDVVDLHFEIENNIIDSSYFTYSFNGSGMLDVMEIVVNQYNCTDTAIITLEIIPDVFLFIPNSFTPNNDGINETFKPVTYGVPSYLFMIFNRWGQLIYVGNEASSGWDGSYQGIPVQNDAYVWKIEYKNYYGDGFKKFGHVTLIR